MFKIQEKNNEAINFTYTATNSCQIDEVRLHLSAAGGAAEAFTIKIDDLAGADYDVPVHTTADMTLIQDKVYQPTRGHKLVAGDKVLITYDNTNNRLYGLTLIIV